MMQGQFPIARKVLLIAGDAVLLLAATYLSVGILFYDRSELINFSLYYDMAPIMLLTAGILFNVNGLFSLSRKRYSEWFLGMAVSMFNLLVVMMAASFFLREFAYPRSVLLLTTMIQVLLLGSWNYIFWRIEKMLLAPKTALLIGNFDENQRVLARLRMQPQLSYTVRYVHTERDNDDWQSVANDVDMIIICENFPLAKKAGIVHFCHETGKQVFLIPNTYEIFCSGAEVDKIDDIPVFRPKYLKPSLECRTLKRVIDLAVAGMALVLTWPLMLIVAFAIKLDSDGPILYRQIRMGLHEKEFHVYKFRTMRSDAEQASGPVMASENDPRITRIGRFMRATRLDELPQIFNVLFGDMSIVGPRPERPFFVEQFKKEIFEYVYRHNVKPGITGWAQVYGKYNTTAYNKLVYDLMYVQQCNIITDLIIILQTIRVLVTKSSTEGVGAPKTNGVQKVQT